MLRDSNLSGSVTRYENGRWSRRNFPVSQSRLSSDGMREVPMTRHRPKQSRSPSRNSAGSPRSIFEQPKSTEWEQLSPRTRSGASRISRDVDVFVLLNDYMKSNRTRAAEMFRKFDRDLDGRLTFGEVQTMVEAVCPGTTAADVEYFFVMLDADTSDSISFKELHQACEECYIHGQSVRTQVPAAQRVIQKLQDRLGRHDFDAHKAFQRFDSQNQGFLEYVDLARLVRYLMPDIKLVELRYIMAHLKAFDIHQDGRLSYEELQDRLEPAWMKQQRFQEMAEKQRMEEEARMARLEADARERAEREALAEQQRWELLEKERLAREEEHRRLEQDARTKAAQLRREKEERERAEREEADRRRAEEDFQRRRAEAEAQRQAEEERQRRAEEEMWRVRAEKEARRKEVEAVRRSEEEEDYKRRTEEEARMRAEAREAAEAARIRREADAERAKREEDARLRRMRQYAEWRQKKYRRYKHVDIASFAMGSEPASFKKVVDAASIDPRLLPREDRKVVWATVRLTDPDENDSTKYPKGSLSRYYPTPSTKRYDYYRSYGFAGKGAATSWGHSPEKRPARRKHAWAADASDWEYSTEDDWY
ncbi:hypothetical protein CYMTET_26467 [Cymbomonas tetramitiformis]|uniref:EF-hand domain-containing protein n=1 Tax=Cymbomonas tetramitiformis TaxID=36881 RepID=A0AAE0FT80_9CHLO|nr:hypothetical protein CYMTET_26467 [Cymbomonas tetramitiformis]